MRWTSVCPRPSSTISPLRRTAAETTTTGLQEKGLISQLERIAALRATKQGQLLLDRAFTSEEAKQLINTLDAKQIDRIKEGVGQIREGTALDLSFKDVSESIATTMAKNNAALERGWSIIGKRMVPGLNSVSEAIEHAELQAEAGNSFIVNAIGGVISSLTNTATGNLDRLKAFREAEAQELKVKIEMSNKTDARVGVQTESSPGLDTLVQARGA